MKHNLQQLDISVDFLVEEDIKGEMVAVYHAPCRVKAGLFVLCVQGSLDASVNLNDYRVEKGDLISVVPGSIIQFRRRESREPLRLYFVAFSSDFVNQAMIVKTSMNFYPLVIENPVLSLDEGTAAVLQDYFAFLCRNYDWMMKNPNREITRSILSALMHGVGACYDRQEWNNRSKSRAEEICKELAQLVAKHYMTNRRVSFYADLLHITPQHLSMTVHQVTGRTVSEIIAEVVIMDIKAQLKSTDQTIQEIAYSLNFPNVSFFGKYFKRHVGMTPGEYRNR